MLASAMLALILIGMATGTASAETRTLKLYYIHTGEKAEITFKKNGRYVQSGLNQLNRFLRDWRRNEPTRMDPRLFDVVWQAYRMVGARDYIHVVSAYRSPATNNMLRRTRGGQAEKSQHMVGKAMDFFIPGVKLSKLREVAFKIQGGGVGYYPRSGSPFVHLDVGNVRAWPRMSRTELARIFPDGKTLHLPADGKPLPGYAQAMAEFKQRRGAPIAIDNSTQVASNTRSGKGLLASLFGGADEAEEESGEVARVTSKPKPAPVVVAAVPEPKPAAEVAPQREEPKSAETLMAMLPRAAVPAPVFADRPAPRPQAPVGVDATVPLAGQAQDEAPEPAPVVYANIPMPTRRPAYKPAEPEAGRDELAEAIAAANTEAGTVVASATPKPRPDAQSKEILAALSNADVKEQVAAIPLPASRPSARKVDGNLIAALPQPRPDAAENASGKGSRVTATPRAAIVGAADPVERKERVLAGARATAKSERPDAVDAKPQPRSVEKPVNPDDARWALRAGAVPQPVQPPTVTTALRAAPSTVIATGFQPVAQENANRFTGKAVTFLNVVKFQSTN